MKKMTRLATLVLILWLLLGFEVSSVTATENGQETAEDDLDQGTPEPGECSASDGSCDSNEHPSSLLPNDDGVDCFDINDCTAIKVSKDSLETMCINNWESTQTGCRATCKLCNDLSTDRADNVYSEMPQQIAQGEVWEYQLKVDEYMYNKVYPTVQGISKRKVSKVNEVKLNCKNRDELCTFWASIGECENNPTFMKMMCAPSCFSCDHLDFETRCPFDKHAPSAWKPGDLDKMFTRIVSDPEFEQYSPQVLSQPEPENDDIIKGSWVVVLDNFLTAEECQTLIDLGGARGYKRSRDVGERKFDGTFDGKETTGRTSTNAWCTEECWEHETTQNVHTRMEKLLDIPRGNYEHLQLLQYEEGQFYEEHHDYIRHHLDRFCGPRILTLFLYLNSVEEGGGTNFPLLQNLTVYPKRGRALLWPSVEDSNPFRKDKLTNHQAFPPTKGVKYGANTWIHQRDFKEAWKNGCH